MVIENPADDDLNWWSGLLEKEETKAETTGWKYLQVAPFGLDPDWLLQKGRPATTRWARGGLSRNTPFGMHLVFTATQYKFHKQHPLYSSLPRRRLLANQLF